MRVVCLFLALTFLLLLPFLFFGDGFDAWLSGENAIAWLRGLGVWGWLSGLLLLMADLVLPIPGTAVISALGFLYGPITGGLLGATGSFLSGTVGYELCRRFGRRWAERLAGAETLTQYEALFARAGLALVAFSRWLPLMPEVVACLAGLSHMPPRRFFLALACGSLPLGFTYAAIGAAGLDRPGLALTLSALLPLVCLGLGRWLLRPHATIHAPQRPPSGR